MTTGILDQSTNNHDYGFACSDGTPLTDETVAKACKSMGFEQSGGYALVNQTVGAVDFNSKSINCLSNQDFFTDATSECDHNVDTTECVASSGIFLSCVPDRDGGDFLNFTLGDDSNSAIADATSGTLYANITTLGAKPVCVAGLNIDTATKICEIMFGSSVSSGTFATASTSGSSDYALRNLNCSAAAEKGKDCSFDRSPGCAADQAVQLSCNFPSPVSERRVYQGQLGSFEPSKKNIQPPLPPSESVIADLWGGMKAD